MEGRDGQGLSGAGRGSRAAAVTWGAAAGATLLSFVYVALYLRGGPRIIDATSYYLEGRALSEGHLAWPVSEPPASVAGRFLVRDTLGAGDHVGVIFPPGYPALLAVGFWAGAPLVVGPLLAGVMVLLTARLTARITKRLGLGASDAAACTATAALLAALSACLRYHTADTMSHGLAATCVLGAVVAALEIVEGKHRSPHVRAALAAALGLALGWLFATRPVSLLPGLAVTAAALATSTGRRSLGWRDGLVAAIAAVPPLALFFAHQHAVTGAWLRSSQALYYAVSDGPAGCFRYGFGRGVGCRIEHGDFVRANLPDGLDAWAATKTTLRRLKMHAGDALNAWPLAPLTVCALVRVGSQKGARFLLVGVVTTVLAYVPFYFDGNYPGGGARFYADTLPLELVALALLAPIAKKRLGRATPLAFAALSVLGFATFGARAHAKLRDREGGRPMLEPTPKSSEKRVVFVATDHGFDLGFDPDAEKTGGDVVARLRGDLTDWLTLREHGDTTAVRYDYAVDGSHPPRLVPYDPPRSSVVFGTSLWPPLAQEGGYAVVVDAPCSTSGRWLSVEREGSARVRLALPRALAGHAVAPRVFGHGALTILAGGERVATWGSQAAPSDCPARLAPKALPSTRARLELELAPAPDSAEPFALDALEVRLDVDLDVEKGGEPSHAEEGG